MYLNLNLHIFSILSIRSSLFVFRIFQQKLPLNLQTEITINSSTYNCQTFFFSNTRLSIHDSLTMTVQKYYIFTSFIQTSQNMNSPTIFSIERMTRSQYEGRARLTLWLLRDEYKNKLKKYCTIIIWARSVFCKRCVNYKCVRIKIV